MKAKQSSRRVNLTMEVDRLFVFRDAPQKKSAANARRKRKRVTRTGSGPKKR